MRLRPETQTHSRATSRRVHFPAYTSPMPKLTLIHLTWLLGPALFIILAGGLLTQVRRISGKLADACIKAPGLDLIVAGMSWVPWVISGICHGWPALVACVIGQGLGLVIWCRLHEACHAEAARGPRIVKYLNRQVGPLRNHLALWITAVSVPVFWAVRFAELFTYPLLVWTVRLPAYKQGEWINVSRQKFDGLIGHDLVWCLYCDWMTGVWSLGSEMLRNVESFWCPIKFYNGKKCANCKVDFPDIEGGWVAPDGNMAQVVAVMEKNFDGGHHAWFGHPDRVASSQVTVEGRPAK